MHLFAYNICDSNKTQRTHYSVCLTLNTKAHINEITSKVRSVVILEDLPNNWAKTCKYNFVQILFCFIFLYHLLIFE